jgi:hypothetical protein
LALVGQLKLAVAVQDLLVVILHLVWLLQLLLVVAVAIEVQVEVVLQTVALVVVETQLVVLVLGLLDKEIMVAQVAEATVQAEAVVQALLVEAHLETHQEVVALVLRPQ